VDKKPKVNASYYVTLGSTRQNRPTLPSRRLPRYRYGMICHRSSLIRQSCHFESELDHMLLQLVDILNTQVKYREGSWHSSLKRLNCWRKRCAKFDSLLLNIPDVTACSLEKVNLKFTLLYLLNHMCYLIKVAGYVASILICKRCKFGEKICYNSRDIEFFLGDYFFGAPCT